jgi:sterol desaturase/sphingolipid hydroxylase (fatty acid hydroxylase superfamily)
VIRLLLPTGTVAFAAQVERAHIGLSNQLGFDGLAAGVATVLLMDLAIYWQHRAFHYFPLLWRAHRVHHSDTGFDVSLGLRFHPFEILPSLGYKLVLIATLGASPIAVLAYESLLLGFSLMTHADLSLPPAWERVLGKVLVTPDWHRLHHSVYPEETDSNFGNILSLWDRLFATHAPWPRDGHRGMRIGLDQFRGRAEQSLPALLLQPFRGGDGSAPPRLENPHA